MRRRGLEPPPGIPGQGPQPCASTNSATGAGGMARARRPLAVAEYSSATGSVRPARGSRGRGHRGAQRPGGGGPHDERGEHAAAAERDHREGRRGGLDERARERRCRRRCRRPIPVEVHVKASVIVPIGARSSSIPLAETRVGAIVAPATSSSRPSTGRLAGDAERGVREAPRRRARGPGAAAGRRRRRRGRWRGRRASSRRPIAPSRTPVSSRWPVASSAAGTTTSTAPIDRPQSTKTATSTRTPGPRSAPGEVARALGVRAPRARDRVRGEGEVADEQEGRAGRHRRRSSTRSRCRRRSATGPQM